MKDKPNTDRIIQGLPDRLIEEMDDGGMGSLRFVSDRKRKFGQEIAEISLMDIDGIYVSFSINLDEEGDIFELDVFKGDFSTLKKFPAPPHS